MAIEFDIFSDIPSGEQAFRRRYWEQKNNNPDDVTKMTQKINEASIHPKTSWIKNSQNATVETVLQERNPHGEILDFYQAQHDLAKNGLPDGAKNGAQLSGAIVQLFDQQFHRPEDFSDTTTFSGKANAFNPKEPYRNFKKTNPDEMVNHPSTAYNELPDKNSIYPFPFGSKIPTTPNMTPTDSLPEGTLASNPLQEGFRDMQKNNTVDWVGNQYLPSGTQDGKQHIKPPQFQQSSSNESRNLLSISWDGEIMDDLGFQDGIGKKTDKQPFGINVGDKLQEFLIERSKTKQTNKKNIDDQLKKTLKAKQNPNTKTE